MLWWFHKAFVQVPHFHAGRSSFLSIKFWSLLNVFLQQYDSTRDRSTDLSKTEAEILVNVGSCSSATTSLPFTTPSAYRSPTIHERIIQLFSHVDISRYAFNSIYENNIQTLPVFGLNIFQCKAKNNSNKKNWTDFSWHWWLFACVVNLCWVV